MPSYSLHASLLAVLLSTSLPSVGRAQQRVGYVARIAEKRGHQVETSRRAELWRMGGELRMQIRRAAPLSYSDIVRVRERVFISTTLAFSITRRH